MSQEKGRSLKYHPTKNASKLDARVITTLVLLKFSEDNVTETALNYFLITLPSLLKHKICMVKVNITLLLIVVML